MNLINRRDLVFDDYQWRGHRSTNPEISGEPDMTPFNRNDGEEVLYLINKIADDNDLKKTSSARKLERMIHDRLPQEISTQKRAVQWIMVAW